MLSDIFKTKPFKAKSLKTTSNDGPEKPDVESGTEESIWSEFFTHINESGAANLIERVDEFRSLLVRLMWVLFGVFGASLFFAKDILLVLKEPLSTAFANRSITLHFKDPLEVFMSYLEVSFLISIIIITPLIMWKLFKFIQPAIPPNQRKYIGPCFVSSLLLFTSGMSFCYFVIFKPSLVYLISLGEEVAQPLLTISEYVSLLTYSLLGFGLIFQLPLVLIILAQLGIVTSAQLKSQRKVAVIVILIVAAIVTPSPDPLSQISMATPMYVLYEIAILVIDWMVRRAAAEDAKAASAFNIK